MPTWRPAELRPSTLIGGLVLLLSVAAGYASGADDPQALTAAKDLFQRYQSLERSFDPAIADLYADDAVIRVKRVYANGVVRHLKVPGDLYKLALRQSAAAARGHGDYNEYSDVRYHIEGGGVRIDASRYSLWHHYRTPWSLWAAPGAGGRWLIREEVVEQHVSAPTSGDAPKKP